MAKIVKSVQCSINIWYISVYYSISGCDFYDDPYIYKEQESQLPAQIFVAKQREVSTH